MPSSVIRSFTYDAGKQELSVIFKSGRHYIYQDVPEEIVAAMQAALSKGEFFNEHVRDQFRFIRSPAPTP